MKSSSWNSIVYAIFLLFLIQLIGSLVESIYILELLNKSLDANALGLLFFFSPVVLLLFRKKMPEPLIWVLIGLLFLARGSLPYLNTLWRMLASGIGTASALLLIPFLITNRSEKTGGQRASLSFTAGLALATAISIFLRTVSSGLDYSLLNSGGWLGWVLGVGLVITLSRFDWRQTEGTIGKTKGLILPLAGVFLVITLVYFAFSAPAVIVRWTEGSYAWIVGIISLVTVGWTGIFISLPKWVAHFPRKVMLVWNLLFTGSLTAVILIHQVPFPQLPASPALMVGTPTWLEHIPLVLMLLLFPVIFLDLYFFSLQIWRANPTPQTLVPGILLGVLSLVVFIFMQIFSNVWGYVHPVSTWFRGKFWLPFLLIAALITLLAATKGPQALQVTPKSSHRIARGWVLALAALFLVTVMSALLTTQIREVESRSGSLLVMTYNIQQANDASGERAYEKQLALIRQLSPDILALQESDSTRVSLNNNDYVLYYAGKLGYYSYYGPKTVNGTYGTAILSKYPLENTRSIYSFSDQDEIGTAAAEIEIGGRIFTIYNVHPDGSDTAMLVFTETLLKHSVEKASVIAMGDYNLRDDEEAYQRISAVYTNAWESVYPSKISPNGTDMSGRNRIDHIFFSPTLGVRNPIYVLPPESASDHPVHWAEIYWED